MKDKPTKLPYTNPMGNPAYWWPTIQTGVMLLVTYRYLIPHHPSSSAASADSEEFCNYSDQQNDSLYPSTIILETLFLTSFLCNAAFGRRPSNDGHHNPVYHQITQAVGGVIPGVLAVGVSAGAFFSRTLFGERAEAIIHMTSEGLSFANGLYRVDVIGDKLYDDAMDRCPATPSDGNMRRLEYIAMRAENLVTYVVELVAHAGFIAMNSGITRFTINDQNRLYVIAGIYQVSDFVESDIVTYINDNIYWAERIVDFAPISFMLRGMRIAHPDHPIHALDVRQIDIVDEKIQEAVGSAKKVVVEAASDALHAVTDVLGITHTNEDTSSASHSEHRVGIFGALRGIFSCTHVNETDVIRPQDSHHPASAAGGGAAASVDDQHDGSAAGGEAVTATSTHEEQHQVSLLERFGNAVGINSAAAAEEEQPDFASRFPGLTLQQNLNGTLGITSAGNHYSVAIRATTDANNTHHHGTGLMARWGAEHHRDLGDGIHSHHENRHVVIILGDIRFEFTNDNADHHSV